MATPTVTMVTSTARDRKGCVKLLISNAIFAHAADASPQNLAAGGRRREGTWFGFVMTTDADAMLVGNAFLVVLHLLSIHC